MEIVCILCSAGSAVAIVGFVLLTLVQSRAATVAMSLVVVLGVGACAAEDRVCEAVERDCR